MSENYTYILTLSCPDKFGIVHQVSGFLAERKMNIVTSAQFYDEESNTFFMRVKIDASIGKQTLKTVQQEWQTVAEQWHMRSKWSSADYKPRVMVMVSKQGHCLNDLLFQAQTGRLPVEIVAVGSNHETLRELTEHYGVPYYHWALQGVDDDNKMAQEAKLRETVTNLDVDIVVLARYMQILSPELCTFLAGRAINIHHSFLPSFKGAKPYYQAHARGVKLIGATAHFVTTDLDEGPIIEQDVTRVHHGMNVSDLTDLGNDIERIVLARALCYLAEDRVLLNGNKTVVFSK